MRWFVPFVLLGSLLLATSATAKKRPIELDGGPFRWDRFSYSEMPAAVKAQVNAITVVNRHGGALIEHDDVVIEYDGDSSLTVTRSLRVVMAAEAFPDRFHVACIDPSLGQTLEVERIVLTRKGKPDQVYTEDDLLEESVNSWFGYYDSDRVYFVELPDDEADATLDVVTRVVTHSQPGFEGFVQAAVMLQSIGLCQRRSLTFRYPKSDPLYLQFRGFDTKLKRRKDGDVEEVSLALEQLMPIRDERWSAGQLVNYPAILASSVQSWDEYHALARPVYDAKMVAGDALRGEVERLTAGLTSQREQAEAIYRFVTEELHYLGLYDGQGGWVPHPATQVLDQRFGDCKDHTVLLATMLREAGIEAHPAFLRAGRMGFVDEEFPFKYTNHAIVYAVVDGEGRFLDGTGSPYGFDDPAPFIRDRTALVLGEQGMLFVATPPGTGESALWSEEVDLTVVHDGTLEVAARITYGGVQAAMLRDRFRTRPAEQIHLLDTGWVARHYVLAEGVSLTQEEDPAAGAGPMTRELTLTSTEHVRKMGPVMLLELPVMEAPHAIAPIQNAHDFPVWVPPLSYRLAMTIELPFGYEVLQLPGDRRSIRPAGRIEAEFDVEGRTVSVQVTGTWNSSRVAGPAAESYAQFRTELAELLDQELILVKGGAR